MKKTSAEKKLSDVEEELQIPVFTSQHAEYLVFVLKKQKAIYITELLSAFELEDRNFALSVVAAVFPALKSAVKAEKAKLKPAKKKGEKKK